MHCEAKNDLPGVELGTWRMWLVTGRFGGYGTLWLRGDECARANQTMSGAVPVNTRRRDWFRILRDLMAAGVSMNRVARKCGRNGTTVKNWACGSEPKDSDARIVLALYAKHCPEKYREHQKHFDIRLAVEQLSEPGEQRTLLSFHE